jgi:hypothetical protein
VLAAACQLYFPDDLTTGVPVPVEAGTITIDRTAQNRRSGSVQIPWSLAAGEDLGVDLRDLTLGGYAQVSRGLRYADGSTELMALGRLRVESVTWDTLAASANLELADRMAQVRDEPFTAPYAAKGVRPAAAAVAIVTAVFGSSISYSTPYNPPDAMGDTIYSGERSDALSALEQSYGAETYFDANGNFVFAAKPGTSEPVVWTVDAGTAGVMVNASENLDRTGIYNGVLVQGQPTADQPPFSSLAVFTDPTSPIRWGGPFGKVALIADSTSVTTQAQADATAQSLLNLRLKQTRSLTLTAAPNPALEAGDTIEVRFPDGRDETHLVDATTISLGTDSQQILTRLLATPVVAAVDQLYMGRDAWRQLADAVLVGA